ncbi:MAG TPA: hypothetical protein VGM82_01730 [Gemmatimonadaceae bacterium]|jgi:hypothetical protein
MTNRIHGLGGALALATFATVFGGQLRAQTTNFDTRWQAWFGCWQPSGGLAVTGTKPSGVCVSPLSAKSAVEVTVIQDGNVVTRDTLDASGVERHVDKQGCVGTESGQWAADNRRIFLHSNLSCGGGLARTGNTIIAMTPSGDWVNVQSLTVGNQTGVRAIHYRDANSLNMAPTDVAAAIGNRQLAISAARTEAGAALEVTSVKEAVHLTDTTAVQSWIIERGTKFNLDSRSIVALADAGIPSSITDVMIGVSYPEHFALKPSSGTAGIGDVGGYGDAGRDAGRYADRSGCAQLNSAVARASCDRCRTGIGYDPMFDDCGLGYRDGYSPYSAYGYGYGYYPYGLGYYDGYSPYYGYSSAPVVVVKGEDQPHGRVVKGQGYTQRGSSGSGSSGGSTSTSGGSGASTSTSSGSGGSGGGGSSSSGGSARTAHPRPPM